jgi:hypothetical protein
MLRFLSFLLKSCVDQFESKPHREMSDDLHLQLIDTRNAFSTSSFLEHMRFLASVSPSSPTEFLGRFTVNGLTHCKDPSSRPRHEFIIVDVKDNLKGPTYLMYLERTASNRSPPLQYFFSHPDSDQIWHSTILPTLKEFRGTSQPWLSF